MLSVYKYKSNWWGFIGKRVRIAAIAFIAVTILMTMSMMPKPVVITITPNTTPEELENLRQNYDQKFYPRSYFPYLGDFFTGNWGYSEHEYPWLIESK
jgi:ABC-type dipeptide/oligopeptide/nickel transport system permease component